MQPITRHRLLTTEEAARYTEVRQQIAAELPELIAWHHDRTGNSMSDADLQPLLADGVLFQLGMPVYLPVGGFVLLRGGRYGPIRKIETNPETHELTWDDLGCFLRRRNGVVHYMLSRFYSNPQTILADRIARMKQQIRTDQAYLAELRSELETA